MTIEIQDSDRSRIEYGTSQYAEGKAEGRREVIAALKTWATGRLDDVGYGGGPAAGELCGMQQLLAKLDELEGGKEPEIEIDVTRCQSGKDGDCIWAKCPQTRDGEPAATGRSCPLYDWDAEGR